MIGRTALAFVGACAVLAPAVRAQDMALETGTWYAFLATPGGRLPFQIEIAGSPGAYTAHVINADERAEIPIVRVSGSDLLLEFDQFDSRINAGVYDDGRSLAGEWTKTRGGGEEATLPFWAFRRDTPRFPMPKGESGHAAKIALSGNWDSYFEESEMQAVGQFDIEPSGRVHGTFLTPTGDYRYLEGVFNRGTLELSCFDGAHAFLFKASLGAEPNPAPAEGEDLMVRTLDGVFYSGNWWQERWTARKSSSVSLPDPEQTLHVDPIIELDTVSLPDPDGDLKSLAELTRGGRCIIVELMGTWCPNCLDASEFLIDLHTRYHDQGLRIVSISFELTGDEERDRAQIRTYIERLEMPFPLLYAGPSEKSFASDRLPFLDRVFAYPSFIILNEHGGVVMSYSGFNGPATGVAHEKMRERFEHTIRALLSIN